MENILHHYQGISAPSDLTYVDLHGPISAIAMFSWCKQITAQPQPASALATFSLELQNRRSSWQVVLSFSQLFVH